MNYRGAGESTGVLNPLTMHDLAGDVAAVIEYLGAPALVLGWAFGNRVARCTASDFPDLVEKLILVCAGGQVEPDPKVYQRLGRVTIALSLMRYVSLPYKRRNWPDRVKVKADVSEAGARDSNCPHSSRSPAPWWAIRISSPSAARAGIWR